MLTPFVEKHDCFQEVDFANAYRYVMVPQDEKGVEGLVSQGHKSDTKM